jgi:hypothetical protein
MKTGQKYISEKISNICHEIINPAQHALAADGSTGREKSRVQSRFPRQPAQKSRIIQAFLAPAMLGAPEALAVGWLIYLLVYPQRQLEV